MPNKIQQPDGSVVPVVAIAGSGAAGSTDQTSGNALAVVNATLTPMGYQQISGPSNAALTVPTGARIALIQAESQPIRWRDDGTNPTATVGMTLPVGSALEYDGSLSAIRFTQTAATGILNVSYYK